MDVERGEAADTIVTLQLKLARYLERMGHSSHVRTRCLINQRVGKQESPWEILTSGLKDLTMSRQTPSTDSHI